MLLILLFVFYLSYGVVWYTFCTSTLQETKQKDMENFLLKAKVISIEKHVDESGRTDWWKINLDDGKMKQKGVFKFINRTRPVFLPDSYHYEIAAYELNKLLGLDIVPPAIEREIEETKGSLQLMIQGCITLSFQEKKGIEPPNQEDFENALHDITVFENLAYCERYELNDILIHEKDWKIYRVDFSEAFAPEEKLIPESEIIRCSKQHFYSLKDLDENEVRLKLKPHLNEEEIKALLKRKNIIIETINKLIEEKGEESVLF